MPPVLSTLYDLKRMKNSAFSLQRSHYFDAIHCRSYLPGLIALKLKKKFACPFIFDMRGFWADERVDGGMWNLKNPVFKLVYGRQIASSFNCYLNKLNCLEEAKK